MDIEKLKALMANKKQAMKRVERAKGFNPGKNRIRVMMGWRKGSEEVWFHDYGQHFIKDAADQIQAVYLCSEATFGKPCKVCGAVKSAIMASGDDETNKILAKAVAGKSILINALHLDSDQPNTPQVTATKGKLFTQLMEMVEENGWESVFGPNSHEIVVTRDGKGLNTTYTATMSIKPGATIPDSVMKQIVDLDDYVKQESDEQERRAIAAVNAVAGLLPSPSTPETSATGLGLPAPSTKPIGAMKTSPDTTGATDVQPLATADVALDAELDDLLNDPAA